MKTSISFKIFTAILFAFLNSVSIVFCQKQIATVNFGGTYFRTLADDTGVAGNDMYHSLKTVGRIVGIGYKFDLFSKIYSQTSIGVSLRTMVKREGEKENFGRGRVTEFLAKQEIGLIKPSFQQTKFRVGIGIFCGYSKTRQWYVANEVFYKELRVIEGFSIGIAPKLEVNLTDKIVVLATPYIDVWGIYSDNDFAYFSNGSFGSIDKDSLFFERIGAEFSIGYKI